MPVVKVVAFAQMSPEAIRVIMMHKGYKVTVPDDNGILPPLSEGKRNLVLLPDYRHLDLLGAQADRIHRVIVMARGHHEVMVQRGIPLLDSTVVDGTLQYGEVKTADQHVKAVERDAVDLMLGVPVAVPDPKPKTKVTRTRQPKTLTAHFDLVREHLADADAVDRFVVRPSCLYCLKALAKEDYRAAVHAAVAAGLDKSVAKQVYTWTRQYQAIIHAAAMEVITKAIASDEVAEHHGVPAEDLDLLASVYRVTRKDATHV
jgi:hypothetical protein